MSLHQVLTDNSDAPFEHLPPEDGVDDAALPVHPFQQRIVQLKSTPPSILARHVFFCLPRTFAKHVAKGHACLHACMSNVMHLISMCHNVKAYKVILAVASEGYQMQTSEAHSQSNAARSASSRTVKLCDNMRMLHARNTYFCYREADMTKSKPISKWPIRMTVAVRAHIAQLSIASYSHVTFELRMSHMCHICLLMAANERA